MSPTSQRLLFTGPFNADHHARALDALCARADAGARDILYIVASGAARRRAIADLLARRGAIFGLAVKTMRSLPAELFRRAHRSAPDRGRRRRRRPAHRARAPNGDGQPIRRRHADLRDSRQRRRRRSIPSSETERPRRSSPLRSMATSSATARERSAAPGTRCPFAAHDSAHPTRRHSPLRVICSANTVRR